MSFAARKQPAVVAFKSGSTSTRLQLLRANDATGHRAYYFVDVSPLRAAQLDRALASAASLDLSQFGQIVASGYGEDVPQDVLDRMRREYGWPA